MSDEDNNKKPKEHLGISFGDDFESDEQKKPGPDVYETANKHLKPTNIPGRPEEDVFNVTRAFDEDAIQMGTIVSDKKHERMSFGNTLKSAFGEWWGDTRKKFGGGLKVIEEKLEKKEPAVQPSQKDRSEIIQKAKEETVQPPKVDHNVVIEESKTLPKDAERVSGVPYQIKKNVPETPEWTTKNESEDKQKKDPLNKKVRVETPDMRQTMVAPVIEKRIKQDVRSFKLPEVKEEEKITDVKKDAHESVPKAKTPQPPKPKLPPIKPRDEKQKLSPPVFVSPKVTEHSAYVTKQTEAVSIPQYDSKEKPELGTQPIETPQEPPAPKRAPMPQQTQRVSVSAEKVAAPVPPAQQIEEPIPTEGAIPLPSAEVPRVPISNTQKTSLEKRREAVAAQTPKLDNYSWRRWVRIGIIVIIIIFAIGLGVFAALKFNVFDSQDTVPQTNETLDAQEPLIVSSFFPVDAQTEIYLSGNKQVFFSSLKGLVETSQPEVTQFYPIRETETGFELVTSWDIFGFLQTGLPLNTVRSLDTVSMFGAVRTDTVEPFIILRSYSFDTLFAGLLEWERTLHRDLQPLFESNGAVSEMFTDAVKNNSSVRVLYDDMGNEVLLYAFVNRNTVIITASTQALTKIIQRF